MVKFNVALIYPKEDYGLNNIHSATVFSNQGVLPPLSLLYVATVLNKKGHNCVLIDANAENLSEELIIQRILESKADLVGISVFLDTIKGNFKLINLIKERTDSKVFVGGENIEHFARKVLEVGNVDYVVRGNAMNAYKFVDALSNNGSLSEVNGLVYLQGDNIIINNFIENRKEFLEYGKPDWSLVNPKLYHSYLTPYGFGTVMGSVGCPYSCVFCHENNTKFYLRPVEEVMEEIRQLKSLGISYIEFYDNVFTINKRWTMELCDKMILEKNEYEICASD